MKSLYQPACCGRPWPMSKGARPKPAQTRVERYVDAHAAPVADRLGKVLANRADVVSEKAAELHEQLHQAATPSDDLIRKIIEELNNADLGVDLEGELSGAMLAAFKKAAAFGATQVGMTIEDITQQVDLAAVLFAEKRGGVLIKDLAGTTDDAMKGLLGRAVKEGMSPGALAKAIKDLGAFGAARAETIARTELAFAHVQGNVEAWRGSREVEGKRWLLADTHQIPDECDEAAAAGVVGLDDDFVDGIDFPPAHSRCCCDVAPVLRELERIDAGPTVDLRQLLGARLAPPEITKRTPMNFTKELKSEASPARVNLSKLLRLRPPPIERQADPASISDAAKLIKALHRTGGEPLRKAAP